ncbi:dihydrofolate reductase [Cladochytrium replicatum]|nr:dihydrofolate reductase [Cladochytrium replicatum]
MHIIVYIAASMDGFISTPSGSIDWLTSLPNPTNSNYGWAEFMASLDAMIMGRKTYETVLEFPEPWPYPFPVYVLSSKKEELSKSLPSRLDGKIKFMDGTAKEIVAAMEGKDHGRVYIDGGETIQGFLKEDLVDEMVVTTASKVLGSGRPLFGEIGRVLDFEVVGAEVLSGHLVKTTYKRARRDEKKD